MQEYTTVPLPEGNMTVEILDLRKVSQDEHFGVAYMIKSEELIKYMGTDKPNREQFEKGFWDYTDYMANRAVTNF